VVKGDPCRRFAASCTPQRPAPARSTGNSGLAARALGVWSWITEKRVAKDIPMVDTRRYVSGAAFGRGLIQSSDLDP